MTSLIFLSLPWLLSATAAAGGVAGRSASQDDQAQAQQAFHQGVDAARQERWVDARVLFERAYQLSPRPVVLINLAGAQARSGRLTEAAKNYHRIFDDRAAPDTASFRRAAGDVLPELEARIPRVRLVPSGLGDQDTVQIDGQVIPLAALDAGYPLDPGAHTLLVKHADAERAKVIFSLAERERHDITLPLPRLAPAPQSSELATAPLAAHEVPPPPNRKWWASPWTWTAAVAIVAATTALLVYGAEKGTEPYSGNVPPGLISIK